MTIKAFLDRRGIARTIEAFVEERKIDGTIKAFLEEHLRNQRERR
jgi:hypothetical protein